MREEAMDGRRSPSPPLPPSPAVASKARLAQDPIALHHQEGKTTNDVPQGSTTPTLRQQQQPIKDAVNTAFDQSPNATALDPELMRKLTEQVTEQVLKNLQVNLGANVATRSAAAARPSRYAPRSPTQESADSLSGRSTPPSPEKDRHERIGRPSPSPEPTSDSESPISEDGRDSRRSRASTSTLGHKEKLRVPQTEGASDQRRDTYFYSRTDDDGAEGATRSRKASAAGAPPTKRETRGADVFTADASHPSHPRGEEQSVDPDEGTTLEKIWQPLFDNGNPTMRLSQFLRGLALHLIDDYEPKGSLVVTPAKMSRFFDETKLAEEFYPWSIIFGDGKSVGRMSATNLSTMYQKLLCQHHLVQSQNHERPSIPGLTPAGFENLITILIQAHPDNEFNRLTKAVKDMPISNADDKRERFPKELSRRLLPSQPNVQAEQRLIASLNHEPLVSLPRANAMPPPPPPSIPPSSSFNERERNPYVSTSQRSNAFDDEDLSPPAGGPIERERKPYSAKEGGGKFYSNEREREREPSRSTTSQFRSDPRSARSNSNLPPQAVYGNNTTSEPMNIPPPNSRSRMSFDRGAPPPPSSGPNAGSFPKPRRNSPPPKNIYPRGDPVDMGGVPASQYAPSVHPGSTRDRYDAEKDDEYARPKPRRSDRSGNDRNDDDPSGRGFPIPQRSGTMGGSGYDANYNPGGPPVGSYSHRGTPMAPGAPGSVPYDQGRRTAGYPPGSMGSGGHIGGDPYNPFAGSNSNNNAGYSHAPPPTAHPAGPH